MNRFHVFVTASVLLLTSAAAHAGIYARAGLLYQDPKDLQIVRTGDYRAAINKSLGGTVAVGYKLTVLRLEGEFNYFNSGIGSANNSSVATSGSMKRSSLFVNGLFELPILPMIRPYAGVGIGASQLDLTFNQRANAGSQEVSFSSGKTSAHLGYQFMAGVRMSLLKTATAYVGYRYYAEDSLQYTAANQYTIKTGTGMGLWEIGIGFGF